MGIVIGEPVGIYAFAIKFECSVLESRSVLEYDAEFAHGPPLLSKFDQSRIVR